MRTEYRSANALPSRLFYHLAAAIAYLNALTFSPALNNAANLIFFRVSGKHVFSPIAMGIRCSQSISKAAANFFDIRWTDHGRAACPGGCWIHSRA